jgi:hypothetical protein
MGENPKKPKEGYKSKNEIYHVSFSFLFVGKVLKKPDSTPIVSNIMLEL